MSSVIPGLGRASLPLGDFKLDAKKEQGKWVSIKHVTGLRALPPDREESGWSLPLV